MLYTIVVVQHCHHDISVGKLLYENNLIQHPRKLYQTNKKVCTYAISLARNLYFVILD